MTVLSYCFSHEVLDECVALIDQQPVADAPAVIVEIMDGFGTCFGCKATCTHVVGPVGAGLCDDCLRRAANRSVPAPVDREATKVFVAYGYNGTVVPLTTLHCFGCGELVDLVHSVESEDWFICRVNGDSRYGYEPYHLACTG